MPTPSHAALFDLTGRVALVTGASRGLGAAMSLGLARAGAEVILNGRDQATLDTQAEAMRREGLRVRTAAVIGVSLVLAADAKKTPVDVTKLPPPSDQKDVTYATDIRPIFEKNCFKCHGPEKHKGDLRLDSLKAALAGGEHGQVIVPNKSAESKLVHSIAHLGDEDDYMPPPDKAKPLTPQQIGLIRAWIDQGAK